MKDEIARLEKQIAEPKPKAEPKKPVTAHAPGRSASRSSSSTAETELKLAKADEQRLKRGIDAYQTRVDNAPKREQEFQRPDARLRGARRELYQTLVEALRGGAARREHGAAAEGRAVPDPGLRPCPSYDADRAAPVAAAADEPGAVAGPGRRGDGPGRDARHLVPLGRRPTGLHHGARAGQHPADHHRGATPGGERWRFRLRHRRRCWWPGPGRRRLSYFIAHGNEQLAQLLSRGGRPRARHGHLPRLLRARAGPVRAPPPDPDFLYPDPGAPRGARPAPLRDPGAEGLHPPHRRGRHGQDHAAPGAPQRARQHHRGRLRLQLDAALPGHPRVHARGVRDRRSPASPTPSGSSRSRTSCSSGTAPARTRC